MPSSSVAFLTVDIRFLSSGCADLEGRTLMPSSGNVDLHGRTLIPSSGNVDLDGRILMPSSSIVFLRAETRTPSSPLVLGLGPRGSSSTMTSTSSDDKVLSLSPPSDLAPLKRERSRLRLPTDLESR